MSSLTRRAGVVVQDLSVSERVAVQSNSIMARSAFATSVDSPFQCHTYGMIRQYDACVKRIERVRLYPTQRQTKVLRFMLDVTRELYNALLQERKDAWRLRRVRVSSKLQSSEITELRSATGRIDLRLKAVYRECEDAVLHRLDLATEAFLRRLRTGERPGYPRFKSSARWTQIEFQHGNRALRLDVRQRRVRIPGVGAIRLRNGRPIPMFGRAWLTERCGRWYCCFECERKVQNLPSAGNVIGVDRGVRVLAATSDGFLHSGRSDAPYRSRIALHQRDLEFNTIRGADQPKSGSEFRRQKALQRLRRAKEHETNARRDRLHKLSRTLVNAADTIALEKLNLVGMSSSARGSIARPGRNVGAKAGLNRALRDSGFGILRQMIVAKAEEAARTVIDVNAQFSSQECSRCGHTTPRNRRRRRFRCIACDFQVHADINAALVIRGRAQSALMSKPHPAEDAGRCAERAS